MDATELAKLEAEVAELEKQAGLSKQRTKAKPKASKPAASNGKGNMPETGTPEWEEWQQRQGNIGKSTHGGYEGKTLLEKMQDALDSQMRRTNKFHLGTTDYLVAHARCEGLACGVGVLRGTNMSGELKNSRKRIGQQESED